MKKIGILAIHGSVVEHAAVLQRLNLEVQEVRAAADFENLDGLILPGGESTTLSDLMQKYKLVEPLPRFVKSVKPVFGTCAGLILLSEFKLLDGSVDRNFYGRQIDSFEADLEIQKLGAKKFPGVFIRAPRISGFTDGEVLSQLNGDPIFVRQGNIFAATFHPELTDDDRIHKFIFQK